MKNGVCGGVDDVYSLVSSYKESVLVKIDKCSWVEVVVVRKKKATPTASTLKYELLGLFLFCFGLYSFASILGFDSGMIGVLVNNLFLYGFGIGAFVPVLAVTVMGVRYVMKQQHIEVTFRGMVYASFYVELLALYHIFFVNAGDELLITSLTENGGLVGGLLSLLLRTLFGVGGAVIFLGAFLLVTILLITKWSLSRGVNKAADKASIGVQAASEAIKGGYENVTEHIKEKREERREQKRIYDQEREERELLAREQAAVKAQPLPLLAIPLAGKAAMLGISQDGTNSSETNSGVLDIGHSANVDHTLPEEDLGDPSEIIQVDMDGDEEGLAEIPTEAETMIPSPAFRDVSVSSTIAAAEIASEVPSVVRDIMLADMEDLKPVEVEKHGVAVDLDAPAIKVRSVVPYSFPPLSMLQQGKAPSESLSLEVKEHARILQATLESFGVDAKIVNASQGPAVTRYELEPAAGVKVSKIVNLSDDIALKLAATDIRMEAPIPGKAAIGIEIPNKTTSSVPLRDVLDTVEFKHAGGGVPVGLGKDIAGNPVIADLAKMPHLLVAGSTGSGKSVCINTLIASILFKQEPTSVKLILIDPKMVELSNYNGIPHLLTPVVTDVRKAASVLKWAVREMEKRYRKFAESGMKNIGGYNRAYSEDAMPYIVIIIDELADLMMVAPADVEDAICRLAQMARAAGMHMVLATQRPSVDVITGIIKANVPSRISFAVSSQIDSRTILDMAGAEKLIGKGDMLFYPMGASKPLRVQGAFISDSETDRVVEYIKKQSEPQYSEEVEAVQQASVENESMPLFEDELMEKAIEMVLDTRQASASMLQRRFRIGYTRAARLIDTMEQMKIVGSNNGSKARDILMTIEQVEDQYFNKHDA